MYTLDDAIQENKEKLKKIIKDYEEELNKRNFGIIYDGIDNDITSAFTALLLKNGINPLIYMHEVPNYFAYKLNIKEIIIPACVTSIGYDTFEGCSSLTSIIIPDSVTSIDFGAFRNCSSLTKITIPESVTRIDEYAFSGCSSLTSIIIPDSVTDIDFFVFQGCENLKSITIPNNVRYIGYAAFAGCTSLTNITIPKNVTSIDYGAFKDCNSLTDVYYEGSEEDWKNIEINNNSNSNGELLNATIHYNS